jgi:methylated-DNA-[protein]-cysteine S-methyltransferase
MGRSAEPFDTTRRPSRQLFDADAKHLSTALGRVAGYDLPMTFSAGFSLFATALGDCAVAWNDIGLTGVWLPDSSAAHLRSRLLGRPAKVPERAPPQAAAAAIAAMQGLLDGQRTNLLHIGLDESPLSPFDRSVYVAARAIAPGHVVTYAMLAVQVGHGASARAVGQALGRNPFPIVVPCHRIIAANGELGGFSAPGGVATKRRLLTIEDARLQGVDDLFASSLSEAPPP